eukprot:CAMPEP_0194539724 /NCGR_PEP_ID=MMETSP0253-20130528/79745_1 /TAXON_ID=2966 /ORGANISM="Noctiluca scintillans" /LENGTH=255 /DNA_ID=CAMNT_0039386027 /DNA_START=93 /DNA_END=856 /DNA_ORIENTATION=-
MSKALEELRVVIKFEVDTLAAERAAVSVQEEAVSTQGGPLPGEILAVGLSARRNMCVHKDVSKEQDRERVDELCRKLTAPWAREKAVEGAKVCEHYEKYEQIINSESQLLPSGVYTMEDLREKGVQKEFGWCPYYAARRMIQSANVVVLNYQYVLDPKVSLASQLGGANIMPSLCKPKHKEVGESTENSIVVFDEAHNIDDVCIESLSVKLNRMRLDQSMGNVAKLGNEVERVKKEDAQRLQDEYKRLVQGLQRA